MLLVFFVLVPFTLVLVIDVSEEHVASIFRFTLFFYLWVETTSLNCCHYRTCRSSPRWYEFGERRWNDILTGETEELGEKPVPVPLCPPQIPHGLTRARTRASAVRGRRLTAWTTARPSDFHTAINFGMRYYNTRYVTNLQLTGGCLKRRIFTTLYAKARRVLYRALMSIPDWPDSNRFVLQANAAVYFWACSSFNRAVSTEDGN
jgi:hypothetical protein